MAKVKGTRTTTQRIEVEVSISEMWDAIRTALWPEDTYIGEYKNAGKLMKYSYTHHHNNDAVYEAARDATEEEIKLYETLNYIHDLVRKLPK